MTYFSHSETPVSKIEETFVEFTQRKDIAIILINQHVCKIKKNKKNKNTKSVLNMY